MTNELDEFLAHHGVKGMHWGTHKRGTSSTADQKVSNRQAKKEANAKRDSDIISARTRVAKKDANIATLAVKSIDGKTEAGRIAANNALNKALKEYDNDPDTTLARQKTGKEKTRHLFNVLLNGVNAYN